MERFTAAVTAREDPGEFFVPDCSIENVATVVTDATYRGHDGVRRWISDIFDVLDDDARLEIEEILATGDDFLVARFCWVGLGAGSQMPLELRWPGAVWFRDGKMARAVGYWNAGDALEAVGLRE
jgi:ketosteroid isomerase-like protein